MSEKSLASYLTDHAAMITAEVELAQRMARENKDIPLGEVLATYLEELQRQRSIVRGMIAAIGADSNPIKEAAGWLVEKIGRFKPNDGGTRYTHLSQVVELEGLIMLATARLSMWETLNRLDIPGGGSAREDVSVELVKEQLANLREILASATELAFDSYLPAKSSG